MPTEQVPDQQQREAEIRERVEHGLGEHEYPIEAYFDDVPFLLDALDRERAAHLKKHEALEDVVTTYHRDSRPLEQVAKAMREIAVRALLHPESTGQEDER